MIEISDITKGRLRNISRKSRITFVELLEDYQRKFNSEFVQKDTQFKTDEERHEYVMKIILLGFDSGGL